MVPETVIQWNKRTAELIEGDGERNITMAEVIRVCKGGGFINSRWVS